MSLLDRYLKQNTQDVERLVKDSAKHLAYISLQKDLQAMDGICRMIDDFEELAKSSGLPAGAYEVFEKAHLDIGNCLIEINQRLRDLEQDL